MYDHLAFNTDLGVVYTIALKPYINSLMFVIVHFYIRYIN